MAADAGTRACLHSPCPEGGDEVDDGGEPVMVVWSLLRETASRWSGIRPRCSVQPLPIFGVFTRSADGHCHRDRWIVFGDDAARGEVSLELKSLLGETGAQASKRCLPAPVVVTTAWLRDGRTRHAAARAIWVVVALKEALNTIWDVVVPPSAGVWSLAKSYLASLVGVLALGFLLLVSLVVTTVLAAGAAYITPFLSEAALHAISLLLSFATVVSCSP